MNIITRRSFLDKATRSAVGIGLASLLNIPPFLKRAVADGSIGKDGTKKLFFLFLRGGNDGVNNVVPIVDPSYTGYDPVTMVNRNRNLLAIQPEPGVDYSQATGQADVTASGYPYAIRLGNGFAALNPALADMVPLFNSGNLAVIHRVGYRSLSRSHFDSERYWEKGSDGTSANRLITDGIWYRTIVESGWNLGHALAAVSIQSNMPMSLRGVQPMTNLSSINRYNLLGVYSPSGSTNTDRIKLLNAIDTANLQPHPDKQNRDLVYNLGVAFRDTLDIFTDPSFSTNAFFDLNGTTSLFPINSGSDQRGLGSGAYGIMQNVKSCAQILNQTDALITGTELGGWDTHTNQVTAGSPHLGGHANLLRRVAWTYYALWRYFSLYGKGGPREVPGAKIGWNDVVLVTMSEFGRTSAENASVGTDHAESSVMYVAGGSVSGGVHGCDALPNAKLGGPNWQVGTGLKDGALYSSDRNVGYLRRTIDYRSVLGEVIRDHLGATQDQLDRIIPAYANEAAEHLLGGGLVGTTNGVPIIGELGIV